MNFFKAFTNDDIASTRTLLHEAIPLTGTLLSSSVYLDSNVKDYSHGYWQSVYDYNYASASANQLVDITAGYASGATCQYTAGSQYAIKRSIYNQMAQVLVGYDSTGSIMNFDEDGNFVAGGTKVTGTMFLSFSRLLVKDEIKRGSFSMTLGVSQAYTDPNQWGSQVTITDAAATSSYLSNSPAGEYAPLMSGSETYGLIYYQAGVVVLNVQKIFLSGSNGATPCLMTGSGAGSYVTAMLASGSIVTCGDALRHRIGNISFNNTTELNSSIYFCRINHNDFLYSANPSYLNGSKIRVKTVATDAPIAYFTAIGLYSADGELLATAKVSEPIKRSPDTEQILRIRLDF